MEVHGFYAMLANVVLSGSTIFTGNSAGSGDGFQAVFNTVMPFTGDTNFTGNIAKEKGGTIIELAIFS